MNKPLEGIKVVELSTYVAAPGAARILGELGADVIKVESFTGDQWRETGKKHIMRGDIENPVFDVYNSGKRSICINIKNELGIEVLSKILETADVFITNTRLKSLKKVGLDPDTLREKYPRLIYARIDGFGDKGPDADTPGFDNIAFWARSGFAVDIPIKTDNSYPLPVMSGVGDCVTGGFLVSGITTALYEREKTGHGDTVNVSLYGAAIWCLSSMLLRAAPQYGGNYPRNDLQGDPLTFNYICKDGEWINLSVRGYAKDAATIYELLGVTKQIEDLGNVTVENYVSKSDQIIPIIREAFKKKTSDEWMTDFRAVDLVIGKLPHMKDVLIDEQAWVNGFIEDFTFKNGNHCAMSCQPIHLSSVEKTKSMPAPSIGEQTDEILKEYGYEERIKELHDNGAVK